MNFAIDILYSVNLWLTSFIKIFSMLFTIGFLKFWFNVYHSSFYAFLFFTDIFLLIFWISLSNIFFPPRRVFKLWIPWVGFFIYIYNFTYLFLAGLCCCTGFSLDEMNGAALYLGCSGFSLQWLLSLRSTGFRARGLQ